jgi:ABC-type phosphate/phosphonate transport system substrate-binding protein
VSGGDPIVDLLRDAHEAVKAAGRAYVDGDHAKAVAELVDARVEISDVIADLRRELADPEPSP